MNDDDTRRRSAARADEHPSDETLSAWLDDPDSFPPAERETIEAHLGACAGCQETLDDLRAIVDALGNRPEIATPRSFALTPRLLAVDAERQRRQSQVAPIVMRETSAWRERQLSVVRWATAVAAALFIVVLGADLLSGRGGADDEEGDIASEAQPAMVATMATGGAAGTQSTSAGAGVAASAATATTASAAIAAPDSAVAATPAGGMTGDSSATTPAAMSGESSREPTAASAETTDTRALGVATETAIDDTVADEASREEAAPSRGRDRLRVIELGLALLIVWLLAALIVLPRLPPRGSGKRDG